MSNSSSLLEENQFMMTEEKSRKSHYPASKAPMLVLIQTYMRSGSSLTGDIMQHSPGAFYVYEPLRSLRNIETKKKSFLYVNGTIRKHPISFRKEAIDVLYRWFTCDLNRLPAYGLVDSFLYKGIKTSQLRECLGGKGSKIKDIATLRKCAQQLQDVCENSPIRILKIIRLELSEVRHLLEKLPNLKIIHLVRDPRATLLSQLRFGMCSKQKGGWSGCTSRHCIKMENDLIEEDLISKRYAGRIMSVLYHNIARRPLETSMKLYEFIKAEFTAEAQHYIYNITMAGNKNGCGICTTRSNSSEHVESWKQKLKPERIEVVNKMCSSILKRYNFDFLPASLLLYKL